MADHVLAAVDEAVSAADGRPLFVRLELTGPTAVALELDEHWEPTVVALHDEAAASLGAGAVVKVERSYRPAIDLVAERGRETLLGKVLQRLDADADLIDRPDLRAEVERTLVAALDGAR